MLPFLKNRMEGAASGPVETVRRKPDEDTPYDMVDAVAEDLLRAIEKKDARLVKEALTALIDHIQDLDAESDQTQMESEA